MKRTSRKAMTVVEVLVAAIILASVIAGVVATFVSVRRNVGRGSERVTAANLARGTLDSLYAEVRADHLDPAATNNYTYLSGNKLYLGAGNAANQTLDNVEYAINYSVAPTAGDYLNVTAVVNFTVKGD